MNNRTGDVFEAGEVEEQQTDMEEKNLTICEVKSNERKECQSKQSQRALSSKRRGKVNSSK
ncbi:hypothetical protein MA16_Dca022309 [Dendrobium catenatum]|uniref:Uncharacterized protein n=1 Tax=Dendrobium catenatum TaxID=906689 RepID=A0A2I0XA76_9ASPA|nr:hypothetical protein MA16_Dca022309 [Dendrobium catenatum]